jgi:NADPH2:quinone reductase
MHAVAFERSLGVNDPAALIDIELPRPSAVSRDILVEVHAVSVNPVDYKVRGGGDPDRARVLGFDAAGIVVEVGDQVSLFQPGDEVWYAGNIARPGTNSELHLVDERIVGRKPTSLSFSDAAALPLTAITAWEGLFDKLKLTSESRGTLYVPGASGGVGSMVLQLAEALLPGVRVIATSSRPETDAWVRDLGAEAWVNHRADDLRGQLADAAPERIDWVFTSHVAEPGHLDRYVSILNPFGEIVAIDDPNGLDIGALKSKSLTFHWELMFTRALAGGDAQLAQHHLLTRVAELVDAGQIRTSAS